MAIEGEEVVFISFVEKAFCSRDLPSRGTDAELTRVMVANFFALYGELVKLAPAGTLPFSFSRAGLDWQILSLTSLDMPVVKVQLSECANKVPSALGKLAELRRSDSRIMLQETIDRRIANTTAMHQQVEEKLHVGSTNFSESSSCAIDVCIQLV